MTARTIQEIFGRYVLMEQLDTGSVESCLAARLDGAGPDVPLVIRRVPLWVPNRPHPVAALDLEARWRSLATQQSLPLMLDAGHVGEVPYLAYRYVPGVTLQHVVDRGLEDPAARLPAPLAAMIAVCMCNALTAMEGAREGSMATAYVHPDRIILPWDGVPVFLGPAYHAMVVRSGVFGVCNALYRAVTGCAELRDGSVIPDLSRETAMPVPMGEVFRAVFRRQITEEHIGRFAATMEALMLAESDAATPDALAAFVVHHFPRAREQWETRAAAHQRLVRRLRAKGPAGPRNRDHLAQVVSLRVRRPTPLPEPALSDADIEAMADAFTDGTTQETEVSVLLDLPVSIPQADTSRPSWRGHVVQSRDGRDMVCVHGGTFKYGPEGRAVHVAEFFMDRYPVTCGDYAAFCTATGHPPPASWPGQRVPPERATHPVVDVSHDDALAYAHWAGKRLPFEEEWEKAARGTRGWLWPHGEHFDPEHCSGQWRRAFRERTTEPVGLHSPAGDSPYGIADIGCAWEWTATAAQESGAFIVRGGAWRNRQQPPQVINRSWETGHSRDVGFRCAAFRREMA
ncbi:MAG: SUMF1/EgtB/PvdO family nonheme iron enzyme [Deltaproteobacteria bacterium]|nr:SUMF1/EgtB/PvdO family nonheme iron enzyme [Deltaproteobacteria bacterium]